MPEVPVLSQLVKQIGRAGAGAIQKTVQTTKNAVAAAVTKTTKTKTSTKDPLRDLDVPDGFFPGCTTHRWDAAWSPSSSRVCHFILPKPRPSWSSRPFETTVLNDKMVASVEIASTPTADTQGSCLVVHFPQGRYLFGQVAEGAQRILTERNLGMGKMANIFLSGSVNWHTTGGLMGMILTLADTRASVKAAAVTLNEDREARGKVALAVPDTRVDIHGGRNLAHAIASTRRFIYRRGTPILTHEIRAPLAGPLRDGSAPDWQDECLQVWYLPLPPTSIGPARAERDEAEAEADKQLLREHVVASMFNHSWKLDLLKKKPLREVRPNDRIFHRDRNNRIQEYKGPLPGQEGCDPSMSVLVREPWSTNQSFPAMLPATQPSDESLCYIVKTHPRRGRFNIHKAREYGVAVYDYKLLTAGEDVVGRDGKIISPDMVVGATTPGNGWIIADIRSAHQVQGFLDRPEWADKTIMQGITAAFWILSDEVANDERLVKWMRDHPAINHRILGQASSPNRIAFHRHAQQVIQMHQIDPDRFPLPVYSNEALPLAADLATVAQVGQPKETLRLAADAQWLDTAEPFMNTKPVVDDVTQNDAVQELAEAARRKLADPTFLAQDAEAHRDSPAHGVVVTPLGTGSSLPSKLRNVSANLVQVPFFGNYIFDCGENTLGQLRRAFGYDMTDVILENLRVLYISHGHADHHLGTASVLARRAQLVKEKPHLPPLAIVASESFLTWLKEYASVEDLGTASHIAFIQVNFSYDGRVPTTHVTRTEAGNGVPVALPNIDICRVEHCPDAMACVFTWPATGLRVAYSGDCRPSDTFAALGRGADLLIHECTFDSELQAEAKAKNHSTMAEALEVGRKMQAKRILLTHFSQRYPKLPIIDNTEQTVLYAFDLMRVQLHDFKKAALFLPALQKLLETVDPGDRDRDPRRGTRDGRGEGAAGPEKPKDAENPEEGKSNAKGGDKFKWGEKFKFDGKPRGGNPRETLEKFDVKYAEGVFKREVDLQIKAESLEELARRRRAERSEEIRLREAERQRKAAEEERLRGLTPEQKKKRLDADAWAAAFTSGGRGGWFPPEKTPRSPKPEPKPKPKAAVPAPAKSTTAAAAGVKRTRDISPSRSPVAGNSPPSKKPRSMSPSIAAIVKSPSPTAKKSATASVKSPVSKSRSPSPTTKKSVTAAVKSPVSKARSPSPKAKTPTKAALHAGIKT